MNEPPENVPDTGGQGYSRESDPDDLYMCRVCRGNEGNLYYPCLCTGSIKYVHQECLVEWLKYSKKEVCELCNHKYSFQPIYRQDMPKALPVKDIVKGIVISLLGMLKTWLVYSLVMISWLFIVPLTAARVYNCIFYLSINDFFTKISHFLKFENIAQDIAKGAILLLIFVCAFISIVWLREQIVLAGPQNFLNIEEDEEEGERNNNENNNNENENNNESETEDDDEDDDEFVEEDEEEPDHLMDNGELYWNNGQQIHLREAVAEGIPEAIDYFERRRDNWRREQERRALRRLGLPEDERAPRQNDDAQQDDNWRDWDRFGEELTWQRLLGLDGSIVFLEHVFWVISLNTLFTVIFAYIPYKFGQYLLSLAGVQERIQYYPSIVSMLCGYIVIASLTYLVHWIVGFFKVRPLYRFFGIMFLIIKVFLLVLMEIGFFPVMCGCWMDICTLPLFSATLSQRIATFSSSPFMSIFLHWMIGMVYVFYSASFVILLREILRPGVLWFMRNLNDPDFNPIQEMIDLPFTRHLRRLVVSTTLFFTTILLIFYIPLNIIQKILPSVLPYNVSMSADTPLSELSLELLILQVVMPAILEHAHTRTFVKVIVKYWCKTIGRLLDLDRYLLSEVQNELNNDRPAAGGGLAAEHQALLLLREPQAYEPYERPTFFAVRIGLLLVSMSMTTTLVSCLFFVVPASIGRIMIQYTSNQSNIHEIYTVGLGLYVCWCIGKAISVILKLTEDGGAQLKETIFKYLSLALRLLSVAIPVVFVLPFLIGLYFQLVVLTPLRLSANQTAITFPYQDWAMGVLQMKIFAVFAMMGPDWWLKTELDQIVQRGLDQFAAIQILVRLILPLVLYLGTFIAAPVVLIKTYSGLIGMSKVSTMLLIRYSYPTFLVIFLIAAFTRWQIIKLSELAEKIKNDRYLVGTQLVNYERVERR
ncbi:unnamed protein product [Caenorhabditis angaria]|uniref:RING-type E3 ubiquitin transferase n=1 Tax=Caenorhabditis angaria TaxID=860376 RepID=A0A9P1MSV4_9PELO|nr:unnamed protein product [Caenorhabditis angaria]